MKFIEKIGRWNVYKLGGIRTEYTGRPDEIHTYYVAFDGISFPKENSSLEKLKLDIYEQINIHGGIK